MPKSGWCCQIWSAALHNPVRVPKPTVGLLALAANVVLVRICFACRETNWAVAIPVVAVVLNVVLSLAWLPTLGARGLLLAVVVRVVEGVRWKALAVSALKIVAGSLAMVAALHWIQALGAHPADTLVSRAWFLFGQVAIGGLVFLAVDLILQKFATNAPSAPDNREAPIA